MFLGLSSRLEMSGSQIIQGGTRALVLLILREFFEVFVERKRCQFIAVLVEGDVDTASHVVSDFEPTSATVSPSPSSRLTPPTAVTPSNIFQTSLATRGNGLLMTLLERVGAQEDQQESSQR